MAPDLHPTKRPGLARLVNFLLYQAGWFACVLGAARHHPWLGLTIGASLAVVHVLLAEDRRAQLRLMLVAAMAGVAVDSALLAAGVFSFPSGMVFPWLPPPWLTVMWIQFATTLHYSLSWLAARNLRLAVFGLVGAPLAFLAGERLGGIMIQQPRVLHLLLLGALWFLALLILGYASQHLQPRNRGAAGYRLLQ